MKKSPLTHAIVITFLLALGGSTLIAKADVAVSAGIQISSPSYFYQPLEPLGTWVNIGSYGRCWHPNGVASDWQPYVNGQWVWTDVGWYWESDEPWSWATYHYGTWVDDPSYGWCWIPGTEWAPSWVTWRVGPDDIGWAPCGPGLSVLAPSAFVFVGLHDFNRHFRGRHDFMAHDPAMINQTRVINNFSRRDVNIDGRSERIAVNEGLPVDKVEHATGKRFTPRPVQDVVRQSQTRRPTSPQENLRERPNRPGEHQPNVQPERQPERPGQPSPTGQEHGNRQPTARPGEQAPTARPPVPEQPRTAPSSAERPGQPPSPTGQEHGNRQAPGHSATPAQPPTARQPVPEQPRTEPSPTERHAQPPSPTGQEHGSVQPPERSIAPAQPPAGHRTPQERPQSAPSPAESQKHAEPPSPTGKEHGSQQPPERPAQAKPAQPAQPAPVEHQKQPENQ